MGLTYCTVGIRDSVWAMEFIAEARDEVLTPQETYRVADWAVQNAYTMTVGRGTESCFAVFKIAICKMRGIRGLHGFSREEKKGRREALAIGSQMTISSALRRHLILHQQCS
jgi:hypothetical protein